MHVEQIEIISNCWSPAHDSNFCLPKKREQAATAAEHLDHTARQTKIAAMNSHGNNGKSQELCNPPVIDK